MNTAVTKRDHIDNRIVALALEGVTPAVIEERLEITDRDYIYGVIKKARISGVEIPRFDTSGGGSRKRLRETRFVQISPAVSAALDVKAAARGVSVAKLAERILETIAKSDLVDAVLDDGGAE